VKLTGRQQDFLNTINQLYGQFKRPVHYSEVADQLGVSKWTAYDVMKQLNELGILDVTYIVRNDNMPGRSTVGFIPIKMGCGSAATSDDKWKLIEESLLARIRKAKHEDRNRILEDIIEEISHLDDSLVLCAYTIALLMVDLGDELKKEEINDSLKEIAKMKIKAELKLSILIGLLIGQAMKKGKNKPMIQNIMQYINKLQHNISDISVEQQNMLWDFAVHTVN
jgi:DNA-binding Lrp family transcriptional regulator